ncbi:MAG: alkaline phosphatase D family protein [Armatimonadota bacterium]|nr:alkaline phosphatase D family protein [Armatimonadota bacterium]
MPRATAACVLLVSVLLVSASPWAGAQVEPFPEGIAVGDVTQDAAVVWTRAPGTASVTVEVASDPGFMTARAALAITPSADADFTAKADLHRLRPGRRYHVRVRSGSAAGPSAAFVTAPAAEQEVPLSLLWGADTYDQFRPFRIFDAMRRRGADLFLFLGDTIYADLGGFRAVTLEQYRQKYREYRQDAHLRAFLASTATWTMWDDHEVANNFTRDHPRLALGLRAFQEYWPIRVPADRPNRLYRSLRWGRLAEVFILDTRQYRAPTAIPDGPGRSMLGPEQKRWLLDGLERSDAMVKIVGSSVMLRYSGRDSWSGYATERDEILRFVQDRHIRHVIFLAGDVHYAAFVRHPEGVYEAVAGPLAASLARAAGAANRPFTQWAAAGRANYGWLRLDRDGIVLSWRDEQDALMHETRIPLGR